MWESSDDPAIPSPLEPAIVVIMPELSTIRTRWFPLSTKYTVTPSDQIPREVRRFALFDVCALSPLNPSTPFPAITSISPLILLYLQICVPFALGNNISPLGSTNSPSEPVSLNLGGTLYLKNPVSPIRTGSCINEWTKSTIQILLVCRSEK